MRPGLERPIARYFVVLDHLGGCQQAGIEHRRTLEFLYDILAFFDETIDGIASLALRRRASISANSCSSRSTRPSVSVLCFSKAARKSGALAILGRRSENLPLCVKDILEGCHGKDRSGFFLVLP
jgi:hypothetical protein